jgi:hypothetical protein
MVSTTKNSLPLTKNVNHAIPIFIMLSLKRSIRMIVRGVMVLTTGKPKSLTITLPGLNWRRDIRALPVKDAIRKWSKIRLHLLNIRTRT